MQINTTIVDAEQNIMDQGDLKGALMQKFTMMDKDPVAKCERLLIGYRVIPKDKLKENLIPDAKATIGRNAIVASSELEVGKGGGLKMKSMKLIEIDGKNPTPGLTVNGYNVDEDSIPE